MKKSPVIGITFRTIKIDSSDNRRFKGVWDPYLNSILEAGGIPLIIPFIPDLKLLKEAYNRVDGLMLPGGEDVDPSEYDEEKHPEIHSIDKERDFVELNIARWAEEDSKPLLAVCRGIQVINVALGGTLYQDLKDQKGVIHNDAEDTDKERYTRLVDVLRIESGTKLHSIIGRDSIKANSLHHQAIKDLAEELKVSAISEDGIIEAVEHKKHPFYLGIQCHPESLWQKGDRVWLSPFTALIEACK